MCHTSFQLYSRIGLKIKALHCILEFDQSKWQKAYIKSNTLKIEAEKDSDKDGKVLYKFRTMLYKVKQWNGKLDW